MDSMPIDVIEFTDPGCPWAYSASPAIAALQWRYGDQLRWRLVTIGLSETAERYLEIGYTPARSAKGQRSFARFGMPFSHEVKARMAPTARMCRAIVATRLADPARERDAFRALQFHMFTTPSVMDEDAALVAALERVEGLDAEAIVGALDDPAVSEAYEADRVESRTAAGGATEFQGKHATSDGPVRYTAPSLLLRAADGASLEAGGFQSLEVYDAMIANLDRSLTRRGVPEDPVDALHAFPSGLVTAEVVAIMTPDLTVPDRDGVEAALIDAVAEGRAQRIALGDDALWRAIG